MSDSTTKVTSGQRTRPAIIRTTYPISTITHTDYVTSTIFASNYEPTAVITDTTGFESTTYAEDLWEHRIHRFLPVILAFAIIGALTVLGSLVYLAYRFYQANRSSRQLRRRQDAEEAINFEDENNKKSSSPVSATLSGVITWLSIPSALHPTDLGGDGDYINHQPIQREPIRYEKSDLNRLMMEDSSNSSTRRPSLAPSWLIKILPKSKNTATNRFHPAPRHMSLPILGRRPTIDNLNVPISSTFKPIDKSSLVLVPRSEIWLDPNRRRGVDELDMWERKKSGATVAAEEEGEQPTPLMWRFPSESAYPDSPESFERRFSARIRSIHIDSRNSSTTTMQEILPPPKKASSSRSKSELRRYDQKDDSDYNDEANNDSTIASTSISYPNALNYQQEEEDDENDHHFSNFEIKVKLPKSKQQQPESSTSNDVRMVRQALETSRLKNSSSQWLYSSGSKSF